MKHAVPAAFALVVAITPVGALPAPFQFPSGLREAPPARTYVLQPGDTVSAVAREAGLDVSTVLTYNRITSPRMIRPGLTLALPTMNGIRIDLTQPKTLAEVSSTYRVFPSLILFANALPEGTTELAGSVFLPGAAISNTELTSLLGTPFQWPTKGGRISSYYGPRNDPFTGIRSSHSGVDIANYLGAPVFAAGSGTVVYTGYNSILGNHIQINQPGGYSAVYGHLSKILVRAGQKVPVGTLIGKVGSTGYSTGPHLHFSAYHKGRLMNPMRLFS
jgi:murein DD-endopeptidase MepM/ murein hydrolase activator NlpD